MSKQTKIKIQKAPSTFSPHHSSHRSIKAYTRSWCGWNTFYWRLKLTLRISYIKINTFARHNEKHMSPTRIWSRQYGGGSIRTGDIINVIHRYAASYHINAVEAGWRRIHISHPLFKETKQMNGHSHYIDSLLSGCHKAVYRFNRMLNCISTHICMMRLTRDPEAAAYKRRKQHINDT